MIKLVVSGAAGKMGQRIIALACAAGDFKIVGAVENPKSPDLGKDPGTLAGCGPCGIPIGGAVEKVIAQGDLLIDFSHPSVTLLHLEAAAKAKKAAIVGTTGHAPEQIEKIRSCGKKIPIVFSSNMSVGVNVMWKLLDLAARALGHDFKVDVKETHHIHKKDAPSGTAKTMMEVLARALGTTPDKIPVESLREGEVVGDHTALFTGPHETLEITHRAQSRDTFALGALQAARWVVSKPAGLYSMADVLGF